MRAKKIPVTELLDKAQILKIEEFFVSHDSEMNELASRMSEDMTSTQRKDMVKRLNLLKKGRFEIVERIVKK